MDSEYESDSDKEFEFCCSRSDASRRAGSSACSLAVPNTTLPFDPTSLENIILSISDQFNFRVIMNDTRAKGAIAVTTGLALAGGLIGKHYAGNVGAVVGGAVGGGIGLGIVAVAMRDIWIEIKGKLAELYDIVYDYIAGMGIQDYQKAAVILTSNNSNATDLALIITQVAAQALGKKILSNLTQ